MVNLIVIFLFGLMVAFFATQNTNGVSVVVANSVFSSVPLYVVVLVSILFGLLLGAIMNLADSISSFFVLRKKDSALHHTQASIKDLEDKIHDLELENTRLKTESDTYKPSLKSKLLAHT